MYNNDSYYEAPYDDQEEHEQFEADIESMMEDEDYSPSNPVNISEALAQATDEDKAIIQDYIQQKEWAKLGQKISVMSYDYWYGICEFILTK